MTQYFPALLVYCLAWGKFLGFALLCDNDQGLVVQSIVSLTSSLRGQLVKCFTTLWPNTLIFLLKKSEKLLHCKSFTHFFNKKYWGIWDINVWNFNVLLTNNVVSFEQPGPGRRDTVLFGSLVCKKDFIVTGYCLWNQEARNCQHWHRNNFIFLVLHFRWHHYVQAEQEHMWSMFLTVDKNHAGHCLHWRSGHRGSSIAGNPRWMRHQHGSDYINRQQTLWIDNQVLGCRKVRIFGDKWCNFHICPQNRYCNIAAFQMFVKIKEQFFHSSLIKAEENYIDSFCEQITESFLLQSALFIGLFTS